MKNELREKGSGADRAADGRSAMLCFGVWRGEAATVLSKAIKLCLECVGIG